MSLKAAITNLAVPMPLPRKLGLVIRHNLTKLLKLQPCCGHPGEPGC